MPLFARWDSDDRYLQVKIASDVIESVAREAFDMNPDRLELLPEFRMRDRQIESIGIMLISELQQQNLGSNLYRVSVKYPSSAFAQTILYYQISLDNLRGWFTSPPIVASLGIHK
jgi:hypothetical protein